MALVKYFRIGWLAGRKHTHTNTSILQSTAITGRNIVRVRLVSQISGERERVVRWQGEFVKLPLTEHSFGILNSYRSVVHID